MSERHGGGAAIRVALVDDHVLFLQSIRRLLSHRLEVVGTATDPIQALARFDAWQPDVLVIDWTFPSGTAAELLTEVKRKPRPPQVLVVSGSLETDWLVPTVRRLGADGFFSKADSFGGLLEAVREVGAGRTFFHDPSAEPGSADHRDSTSSRLSMREFEVFECLGRGMKSREIAEHLRISQATVRTHVAAMLRSLGCASREALIAQAVRWVSENERGR